MIPLGVLALLLFAYSLVSRRVERIATAPIVFTLAGCVAPFAFPEFRTEEYHLTQFLEVAEAGLVLLLFTDATRTDLSLLRRIRNLPARLLGPGMLMTIGLGAAVGLVLMRQMSIWEALILAAILAPTDAGLGQVIVESPRVPAGVRQALNVEAGLNDGLSVPFLLFFMAMLVAQGGQTEASLLSFIGEQLGGGVALGLVIGLGGGWLIQRAIRRGGIAEEFVPRAVLVLPALCFLSAEAIGASMFIAAFVAGLAAQSVYRGAGKHAVEFTSQWGQLINLAVFFLFGVTVARSVGRLEPVFFLYALLSLTLVRMLPVGLSLIGTGLSRSSVLFMGWFGPRGLASIVLGLVYVEQEIPAASDTLIKGVVIATVLLSILLHGFTAQPGIAWYARQVASLPPTAPEHDATGTR